MVELTFLRDLVVILGVAVAVVALLQRIGVPSIAGFILAGAVVGPPGLGLVHDRHEVEILAEIGVALLLFGIGLELQLVRLRRLWKPVVVGGALQVGATAALTSLAAWALGLPASSAVFLGLILAVSSTAIVLRGLQARGEIDAPHGKLTIGILIFQDLSVVPMILVIPLLAGGDGSGASAALLIKTLLKAILVLSGVLVGAWVVVPRVLHWIARTRQRELFVLTVFLVCMGTAWLVTSAGVSLALGAFLAGMVVAGSEYRHQAMAELIPFRGVFTSLFFVSIGMLLDLSVVWRNPGPLVFLLLAILFGKFLIVFVTAALMQLPLRVCVLAAAALAQVGEFSFVLMHAATGTTLLEPALAEPLMLAVILSMLVTPLAIVAGPKLAAGARKIRPLTRLLDVKTAEEAEDRSKALKAHVIIAGFGLAGQELARALRECCVEYVIVDLNPDNIREAARAGEPAYFGDVTSAEVLKHLGVARAREIVLVINDPSAAERAVRAVRDVAPDAYVLVRSRYVADVELLLSAGASEVVPAEIEVAAEVAARVLSRHNVREELVEGQLDRIRARRSEHRAGGFGASEGGPT